MLSFKLFAGTDIGLRENNEDNFTVCPDLTKGEWIIPTDCTKEINLGRRGCMMVVADGMGGQNAGEVASDIAVKTVEEMFSPETLPADILNKPKKIEDYLKLTIEEADIRVKAYGKGHPEADGLGSTIVMAWLIGDFVYVAWLGDSRAYSYRQGEGIGRMSKDHSYVQQLVDKGTLTDDEAMHHPQSNIITRSLGDTSKHAKADVIHQEVHNGDITLLCSDGLCGVCTDAQIGSILMEAEYGKSLQECKELLTEAALANGGSDNITIALMQICRSGINTKLNNHVQIKVNDANKHRGVIKSIICIFALLVLISCFIFPLNDHSKNKNSNSPSDANINRTDTTNKNTIDTVVKMSHAFVINTSVVNYVLKIDEKQHKFTHDGGRAEIQITLNKDIDPLQIKIGYTDNSEKWLTGKLVTGKLIVECKESDQKEERKAYITLKFANRQIGQVLVIQTAQETNSTNGEITGTKAKSQSDNLPR